MLADRPNSIQHWQLRDLVSCVEDDAGKLQLYTVCGRRTYRFDVETEKVCARAVGPANESSTTSHSAASPCHPPSRLLNEAPALLIVAHLYASLLMVVLLAAAVVHGAGPLICAVKHDGR